MKFLSAFLLLLCLAPISHAQTNVGGAYFSNQTWTLAGSPYIITSDVQIAPAATLTIQPGVAISFNGGSEILIKGGIQALGTLGNEISIDGTGAQNVIHFLDANMSMSLMEYCNIAGGTNGIWMDGQATQTGTFRHLQMDNSIVKQTSTGGTLKLTNSLFDDMEIISNHYVNDLGKIWLQSSTFTACRISGANGGQFQSLLVESSKINDSDIEAFGYWISNIQFNRDTMRNCNFRSDYGKCTLFECLIADSEFGNKNWQIFNNSDYRLTRCMVVNSDFIGGDIAGNDYVLFLTFNQCLVQKEVGNQFSVDGATFRYSALLGPCEGLGLRAYALNSRHSLFKNHDTAMYFSHYPASVDSLWHCNIFDNHDFNVISDSTYGVNARHSWWGTTDSLTIFTKIKDYYENLNDGEVVVSPWATTPEIDAPISPPNGLTETAGSGFHTLTWGPNPELDLEGYALHYGNFNGFYYSNRIALGNVLTYQIPDSIFNQGYAITAYDDEADGNFDMVEGHESGYARDCGFAVGIANPTLATAKLKVYPNPAIAMANGSANVHLEFSRLNGQVEYTLSDLQGRIVVVKVSNDQVSEWKLPSIPAGLYLVRARSEDQVATAKLLIR